MGGQADLPRPGAATPADDGSRGSAMMGRTEGPPGDQGFARGQKAGDAVNTANLYRLLQGQRWQNGRQAAGQHGLAGTGRPN